QAARKNGPCADCVKKMDALDASAQSTILQGGASGTLLQGAAAGTMLQGGTAGTMLRTGTQSTMLQGGAAGTMLQTGTQSTTLQGGTAGTTIQAQVERQGGPVNILFVIDCSYSMKEGLGGSMQKMDAAKQVLQNALSRIPGDVNL